MGLGARLRWASPSSVPVAPVAETSAPAVHRRSLAFSRHPEVGRASPIPGAIDRLRLPGPEELATDLALVRPAGSAAACSEIPAVTLDIETTGLGATPIVVMVALAWPEGSRWRVEQWSLRRPEGEARLLAEAMRTLAAVAGPRTALLTFNGASFDLPVLRIRLGRTGGSAAALDRSHVDLLPACRRLWSERLPDCRLSTLERRLLGVHRVGDPSGAEVARTFACLLARPSAVDDPWLRTEVQRAEAHNQVDVLTLGALARALAARLRAPRDLSTALRAARHFVRIGRPDDAVRRLEPALAAVRDSPLRVVPPATGRGESASDEGLLPAVLLLADLHRRAGRHPAAASLWSWVCRRHRGHVGAHEALAKHLEHRCRQPAEALAVAEASAAPCPRRLARLRRKLAAGGPL